MINPLSMITQIMQGGKNPQQFINQLLNNNPTMQNPMIQNAVKMYQNGDNQGLENLAKNLCKEKNLNIEDVKRQIMSQMNMR